MAQTKYKFDKETWKKIIRGVAIALSGPAGVALLDYVGVSFGAYSPLVGAGLSILVNVCREYVKGEEQPLTLKLEK